MAESSFEVLDTDLGGRLGRLKTKSGSIETPCVLPVIHPARQEISAREIFEMGYQGVMTNAYLTMKHHGERAEREGIHKVIGFAGPTMTDSGGYQVLEYGRVEVDPTQMALFQEKIGSDIAVVLDQPTGFHVSRARAERSVKKTLEAAKETLSVIRRRDILWTGPIQGGANLDLVASSSKEMDRLGFDLLALGSPTGVMETYDFRLLAEMISTAKRFISPAKPLHLFGAGHPMTLSLAVALGCDLFDSASYILFAKEGRYMTERGTIRLRELRELPCECSVCSKHTGEELASLDRELLVENLAIHNLLVLQRETRAVKQAIREGRLWEHVGLRARAHPRLWEAFAYLGRCLDVMEDGTPLFKPRAISILSHHDCKRPEVVRCRARLKEGVSVHEERRYLLVLAELGEGSAKRPGLVEKGYHALGKGIEETHIVLALPPFGLVPLEVSDVFPFSQYLMPQDLVDEHARVIMGELRRLLRSRPWKRVVVFAPSEKVPRLRRMLAETRHPIEWLSSDSPPKELRASIEQASEGA